MQDKGNHMTKRTKNRVIVNLLLAMLMLAVMASCSKDDGNDPNMPGIPDTNASKTVFVYMPWTGDASNLYEAFQHNLKNMKTAIQSQGGLGDRQLMVFISLSDTTGVLIREKYENGECVDDTIRRYSNTNSGQLNLTLNSQSWITYIVNQVKSYAPADAYSMIIGSHGYGWITAAAYMGSEAKSRASISQAPSMAQPWETRCFGGSKVKTDVTTLAAGIAATDTKMQYILFDDCNMSNIEVAYDLKDVCDHLIACPTEIMAYGMPYQLMFSQLAAVQPDYQDIVDKFIDFYNEYNYPYGTIGVVATAEVDSMASILKQINAVDTLDASLISSLQTLDGYSPPVFYDLGDYVRNLATDSHLLSLFEEQLKRLVPYSAHTSEYYSALWRQGVHPIKTFSGITISDPSTNNLARNKEATNFWKASH